MQVPNAVINRARNDNMLIGSRVNKKLSSSRTHSMPYTLFLFCQASIVVPKEIGDEEPHYSTKISIFSFIWAGLAALHKASTL